MEHFTVGGGIISFTISRSIKNSTEQKTMRQKDGRVANYCGNLLIWIQLAPFSPEWVPGYIPGSVIFDVKNKNNGLFINLFIFWSAAKFTKYLRARRIEIGVGTSHFQMYSGHSVKRGCVPLYWYFNIRDKRLWKYYKWRVTMLTSIIRWRTLTKLLEIFCGLLVRTILSLTLRR